MQLRLSTDVQKAWGGSALRIALHSTRSRLGQDQTEQMCTVQWGDSEPACTEDSSTGTLSHASKHAPQASQAANGSEVQSNGQAISDWLPRVGEQTPPFLPTSPLLSQ